MLILDAFNRPVSRYNLTTYDLLRVANRQTLSQMLLSAAAITDTDRDGLPDVWETFWFESLAPTATGDDDGDGADNRTEFAFGSNPRVANSGSIVRPLMVQPGGKPALAMIFRRFAGGGPTFVVETSSDLVSWTAERSALFQVGSLVNLYDGTGGAEVRFQQTSATGALPNGFLRVRTVWP